VAIPRSKRIFKRRIKQQCENAEAREGNNKDTFLKKHEFWF